MSITAKSLGVANVCACELNATPIAIVLASFLFFVHEGGVGPKPTSLLDFFNNFQARSGVIRIKDGVTRVKDGVIFGARHRSFLLFVVQAEGLPRFRGI
jgi:hypothetical protein